MTNIARLYVHEASNIVTLIGTEFYRKVIVRYWGRGTSVELFIRCKVSVIQDERKF